MPWMKSTQGMENSSLEPIAIVGMACRLPGSVDSPSKFWDLLRDQKSVQTPRVPENRFSINAHYHPENARPGSFSSQGGYFLDGKPEDFDPSFFNMTPVEAQWLDPQQRKMLEVSYECLENAGITLDQIAGTNTAVYVASFTSDYQQMSIFERDFRHNYAATGVDVGIISNRINNTFNLNGPSFTINTACSSSVYAIHNACHALRNGDCNGAIVGGVNLILIVDQHMNTAKLGVLSPTSECHTFDERADGYGRAEGAGALYLKRLSDAVRDKDVIRGVIRSSATNTNGKVPGMGITFPNAAGQEKVLRHAYERANLDPNKTAYLECHGTGTPTGDPIECQAVSQGMNDTRSREKPLLLSAVKSNIGHSEAASGIFATMKAALSTERGQIPGVHGFRKLNPKIHDKEWNIKIVEGLTPWPADFDNIKRASVSSFGYGGTNAHLVIESIESICPWYEHGQPKTTSTYDYSYITRPFLVSMSAHDRKTLDRNIAEHEKIAADYHLPDLAYTLNSRRTQFAARAYTTAWPGKEGIAFNPKNFSYGSKEASPVRLAYILTGQGAQWARMGFEAMQQFPDFASTIDALDEVLQRVEPRPTWSLRGVLEDGPDVSRIGEAEISQPACTAIQIAIIDLLSSWGIEPAVTVGHSSGEIAASYAAGRISAPQAILVAYFRGFAVATAAPVGTMIAVGLSVSEVADYIPEENENGVVIACDNSPGSVTLSGTTEDIAAVKEILDECNIFNRALKTGKAYHSPQMDAVAPLYVELYTKACCMLTDLDITWRRPYAGMISSLTGTEILDPELSISYWCENLRNRVLFNSAVKALVGSGEFVDVNVFVEIGPHAALGGPFKQICVANGHEKHYVASIIRGGDSAVSLLKMVGELYVKGFEVDFELVNSIRKSTSIRSPSSGIVTKHRDAPRYLPDLPPYSWNYDILHWAQPRTMAELRQSNYPRHDILGRRIFGLSTNASTWKNILRHRDVPWLQDHTLGGEVIFPAAGHLSLSVEALLQHLDLDPVDVGAIKFRDINIQKALVVPDTDEGVEIHTSLQKSDYWYFFRIESYDNGHWIVHCTGKIRRLPSEVRNKEARYPEQFGQLHQQVSGKVWYRSFNRVGFQYGPAMQTVGNIRANGKDRVARGSVKIQKTCESIKHESRYLLHPSTIDGCLHMVIAAVHKGQHKAMPWGVIPLEIEEMTIELPNDVDIDTTGQCTAWTDKAWDRYFNQHVQLFGSSDRCILDIKNLKLVKYDAAVHPASTVTRAKKPYQQVTWVPIKLEEDTYRRDSKVAMQTVVVCTESAGSAIASELQLASIAMDDAMELFDRVIVDDADGSILTDPTPQVWNGLQALLASEKLIVWVTRGANEGNSVNSGIPQGFLRVVRSESASSRIALLDVDLAVPIEELALVIEKKFSTFGTKNLAEDLEFWLKENSGLLVSRIRNNDRLNAALQDNQASTSAIIPKKALKGGLENNEVVFELAPSTRDIDPLHVEIEVLRTELSLDDFSAQSITTPRLVAGTIIRTGAYADVSLIGQTVVAYTKEVFRTVVVTKHFTIIGAGQIDALTAALPQLCRAVDATVYGASATTKDHVLLLPSTAAMLESVRELSRSEGFRVSLAPDDVPTLEDMLQATEGPNIVIVSSLYPHIEEVWRSMPRGSKLVFSDVEIGVPLDPKPFARGVRLSFCGISKKFENDPSALLQVLQRAVEIFLKAEGPSSATCQAVLDIEELSNVDEAKRKITEQKTSILGINPGKSVIKIRKKREDISFKTENAYLLVGCLGGLGRSLTAWMFERGCRNFCFLSRSGASNPVAAQIVVELRRAGASVHISCVDVSDTQAVTQVVREISAQKPIKGVLHAAMVLQDSLFQNLTLAKYQAALRPKMQGAYALHKAVESLEPLDFFVMTSSLSAVTGNPGQSNYCAGNSYLDFLALYRRKRGLAASSLALPMVEDVGVVAENPEIAQSLMRKNPFMVNEHEMLQAFEAAILQTALVPHEHMTSGIGDVQLILGLEPDAIANAMESVDMSEAYWMSDARLSIVLDDIKAVTAENGPKKQDGIAGGFLASLEGWPKPEVLRVIGNRIVARTARILGMKVEQFDLERASVASHGVDSMIGVELQSWLFKELGLQIGIQILSNPKTTFAGLSEMVAQHARLINA